MITEILGALIALGAVLVLIMRYLLNKGKTKEKESVEVSASRLRYEIERSGDAVIGRMQIHVERLERLLAEANAQKAALDERLAALAQWEKAYGARLGALPQQMEFVSAPTAATAQASSPAVQPVMAARRAPIAVQPAASTGSSAPSTAGAAAVAAPVAGEAKEQASSFQATLMKQMAENSLGGSVDLQLPPEDLEPSRAMNSSREDMMVQESVPQEISVRENIVSSEDASDEAEDDEEYEYEEDDEEEDTENEYEEDDEEDGLTDEENVQEEESESETITSAEEDNNEEEEEKDASTEAFPNRQQEQVRAFLRQGMSAEEISQRLGLGLGAIELVRHMEKRAHEE